MGLGLAKDLGDVSVRAEHADDFEGLGIWVIDDEVVANGPEQHVQLVEIPACVPNPWHFCKLSHRFVKFRILAVRHCERFPGR